MRWRLLRARFRAWRRKRRFSRLALGVVGAAMVLGAIVMSDCADDELGPTVEPVVIGPDNIAIAHVALIETGPYIAGALQAEQTATLRAEVGGQIIATFVEKGEAVGAGELLARIDDSAFRDAFRSARAAVATARQALELARRNVGRMEVVYEAGGVALQDVESARLELATAQSRLADAVARLSTAREQLAATEIRAPFSGKVSERLVSTGDVVQPGRDLFTVVDPSSMRLEAEVPAEDLGAIHIGAPVNFQVHGYPALTFQGRVDRIGPAADSTTREIEILVAIPNPTGALIADLFAEGRVTSRSRQGIVIPETAVESDEGVRAAVQVVRRGRAWRVPVELGLRDESDEVVEVVAGLVAGDTVLVGTARAITEGTPVRVRTLSGPTAGLPGGPTAGLRSGPAGVPSSPTPRLP